MPYSRGFPVAFLTHPFELALGAVLVFNGIRGIVGALTPSVASLPTLPLLLYIVVSMAGGLGVIIGLLGFKSAPPPAIPKVAGPRLERASLYLVAASYAVLAVLLVGVNGTAGVAQAFLCTLVGAACILRTIAIRRAAKIIVQTLAEHREASA